MIPSRSHLATTSRLPRSSFFAGLGQFALMKVRTHIGVRRKSMPYLAKIERPGGAVFYAIRGEGGRLLKWLGRNASAKDILTACRRFGAKARPVCEEKETEGVNE